MGWDELPEAVRAEMERIHGQPAPVGARLDEIEAGLQRLAGDRAAAEWEATAILASIEDAVARMDAQRARAEQAKAVMERATATLGPILTAVVDDVLALGHKIVAWWDGAREAVLPHFHALPEVEQRRVDALERMWAAFRAPEV